MKGFRKGFGMVLGSQILDFLIFSRFVRCRFSSVVRKAKKTDIIPLGLQNTRSDPQSAFRAGAAFARLTVVVLMLIGCEIWVWVLHALRPEALAGFHRTNSSLTRQTSLGGYFSWIFKGEASRAEPTTGPQKSPPTLVARTSEYLQSGAAVKKKGRARQKKKGRARRKKKRTSRSVKKKKI